MRLQGKLGFDTKLSFGVGQAAEGLFGAAYGTFLIFYYNQVLGMSGSLAGAAVGIALVVDAFTDPLAGSLSDHWKSRYGRRHPFMYASIVPLAVSFYFLFNPLVTSQFGLFIWLVVFSNATRTAMSLYHVPHIALGAEMSEDYDERSKLVGYRMFFANVGVLFTFAVGFLYFFTPTAEFANGQLNASAYPNFALLLAILMGVTIFWSAWGTPGRDSVPARRASHAAAQPRQRALARRPRHHRRHAQPLLPLAVSRGTRRLRHGRGERRPGPVRVHLLLGTRPPGDPARDLAPILWACWWGRSSARLFSVDSARRRA